MILKSYKKQNKKQKQKGTHQPHETNKINSSSRSVPDAVRVALRLATHSRHRDMCHQQLKAGGQRNQHKGDLGIGHRTELKCE